MVKCGRAMPITPPHQWSESIDAVSVTVIIKMGSAGKLYAAMTLSDVCVKITTPTHLFLLDLFAEIDYAHVAATVTEDCVELQLPKV